MRTHTRWTRLLLTIALMPAFLVACGPEGEEAAQEAEQAAEQAGEAAGEAMATGGAVAETAVDEAGEMAEEAATEVGEAVDEAATEVDEAMAEGEEMMAVDESLGEADNPIVISYVPSGDQAEIVTGAETIEALLEEQTGLAYSSNVATSYAAVVEAMGANNAHVGFLNTFSYLLAHEEHDVRPILVVERFGTTSYASLIVTQADSGIETLADLEGVRFCRPDPLSTSGWIIPSVMLQAAGVDPDSLDVVDSGSHDNVVTAVYNGDCDAGAIYDDARSSVEDEYADVTEQVVVVDISDDIPNDNVSVSSAVSDELATQLQDALLAVAETEDGAAALTEAYGIEAFQTVEDGFYDEFRATLEQAGVSVEELASE